MMPRRDLAVVAAGSAAAVAGLAAVDSAAADFPEADSEAALLAVGIAAVSPAPVIAAALRRPAWAVGAVAPGEARVRAGRRRPLGLSSGLGIGHRWRRPWS